jgi:hypothetical protein
LKYAHNLYIPSFSLYEVLNPMPLYCSPALMVRTGRFEAADMRNRLDRAR